jgi:hypothetical protein
MVILFFATLLFDGLQLEESQDRLVATGLLQEMKNVFS